MRILPPERKDPSPKKAEAVIPRGFTRNTTAQARVAGALADVLLKLPKDDINFMLEVYRQRYGEGAHLYARRTLQKWQTRKPTAMGQTLVRFLELIPPQVEAESKFAIVNALRDVSLRHQRTMKMHLQFHADEEIHPLMEHLLAAIEANYKADLPVAIFRSYAWLNEQDGAAYWEIQRNGEREQFVHHALDFTMKAALLQRFRQTIAIPVQIKMVFEIPGTSIYVRILKPKGNRRMHDDDSTDGPDDKKGKNLQNDTFAKAEESDLLARWQDLELESRFKSGDMSYPEYVLRNMDQFFTKEQQADLHMLAAQTGLELERTLMEIQIKSRTSEADLQKLVSTLKTLQEKGITAEIISRHETPSGHIEISARSGKKFLGCLPWGGGAILMIVGLLIWLV